MDVHVHDAFLNSGKPSVFLGMGEARHHKFGTSMT